MNLALLIFIPLILGAVSFWLKGKQAWYLAILSALATLFLSLNANTSIGNGILQFKKVWMPSLGTSFNLRFDHISFLLCLLTGIVFLLVFILTGKNDEKHSGRFYGLMQLSMSGLFGVFLADDAFLFYIFWELALIPVYFLCSFYGYENRTAAAFKFFIYTFIGSLLMLVALIYIHLSGGANDFSWEIFIAKAVSLPKTTQYLLFLAFFIAFAIKMPLFPFHTWQPNTYHQSYTPVTIVLSALMVKMGLFALMRWLMPWQVIYWNGLILWLSVISVVYASLMALVQTNIKRLVAYSSIAHIGLMCAALFSEVSFGVDAVIIQMFNHGINILGMWICVYFIEDRLGTLDLKKMGGIAKVAPIFTTAFVLISFANIALPLTNSFAAEFMMFNAIFNAPNSYSILLTILAGLSVILGAVYTLRMVQQVAFGPISAQNEKIKDTTWHEWLPLVVIMIIILAIGFYPNLLLNIINFSK